MRKMKDSGIEWIGEIPEEWETLVTKHLFHIVSGATPKSENPDYFDGEIAWITPADYKTEDVYVAIGRRNITELGFESCNTTLIPSGSIIFSKRAPIGSVAINTANLCTNQGCLSCIPQTKLSIKYYYYHMAVLTEQYNLLGSGTTFKEISATSFSDFKLSYPSHTEQKFIADFLDHQCAHIDNIIEKTKASIEEYKKLRQAVITQAVTKGVRGDRPMKDSGIERVEQIPSDWIEMKMKHFMYIRARLGWKGLKADEYVDEGYIFIGTPNIDDRGVIDWKNVYYITKERYDESPEIKLSIGDVLLTKDGAGIGKCAYIEYLPSEAAPNGSLTVITCNELMLGKYLFYYLKSYYFQKYIDQIKAGMGVPHLFQGDLKEISIPVPPIDEQAEIAAYLDQKCAEIDTLITKKQQFLAELESYKKSMIYEYVTGKKEVPHA